MAAKMNISNNSASKRTDINKNEWATTRQTNVSPDKLSLGDGIILILSVQIMVFRLFFKEKTTEDNQQKSKYAKNGIRHERTASH